ncbi:MULTISPECIES: RNA polymerase sigma factor [unclassified Novosphingobium]|uniref:RNA polymerase sigma factor n=1 Tax=unclassified Novosphingobium TaxID=2644732 RepID=UPI0014949C3B|nr:MULTISPECIES: sigma-70 family RNA polymerase sigma factor [unclassified Novosphingobium]MBB3356994.1 RNA polymerase sigma-70 factor (ECF subfamily) [Novosphingobium sp. BK256]MBB3373395.1 RNA polymerase sigma-70 factor (ECF subfamily) [Novosphingobium sp. BK280]MBB3377764.1 RNA polymerase sigma-70 factor (ECF subfamily) [Novosphingobium sp. BK258]MBB3418825.1 RNA polymerase sigma-70 factor (ECF subfamily) [Novosphingobium sp. BK267]MBB3450340.1 RNA polymerase sigma-70 factor (ECF subfamily)
MRARQQDEFDKRPATSVDSTAGAQSNARATLLATFAQEYDGLLAKLTARLRSREAALDALHDVYIKLRATPDLTVPLHPGAYLYRAAVNHALNSKRKWSRALSVEPARLEAVLDPAPDPERIALAAIEMERALAALHELPSKRREIFLARWRDERTNGDIAVAFGMHKRSVQKDLAWTERYLRRALGWPGGR